MVMTMQVQPQGAWYSFNMECFKANIFCSFGHSFSYRLELWGWYNLFT